MSIENNASSCNHNSIPRTRESPDAQEDHGRVVTDAVHERFREKYVFCKMCETKFVGNEISINNHFNASHPSDELCVYCKGKVYRYYDIAKDDTERDKEFIYHKCEIPNNARQLNTQLE